MNFSIFTSKTFWGALATAIGAVAQADWSHGVPYLVILTALGGVLGVIGLRSAIAANGVASSPVQADAANGKTQP